MSDQHDATTPTAPTHHDQYALDRGVDRDKYIHDIVTGGLKGLALGAATFFPFHFIMTRRKPTYAALPPQAKAFLGLMYMVPVATVFAEKAGEHHISSTQWRGAGKAELDREAELAVQRWEKMSTIEKIKDWGTRHQYGIVGGAWVASLGLAFGMVARDKYQTFPQKLVQARMWAQGLTVGVVVVSAVLAGANSKGEKPPEPVDHSWVDMLDRGGNLTKEERIRLHSVRRTAVKQQKEAIKQ